MPARQHLDRLPPRPPWTIVASDAIAGEFGTTPGRFSIVTSVAAMSAAPLTVNYTVGGSASNGVDYATLSGSVTIPANANVTNIFISPLGNNLSAPTATITLTLAASTNYTLTNLSSAAVTLLDRPLDVWRRANFTAGQSRMPTSAATPPCPPSDGLPNLVKYALGLSPFTAYTNIFHPPTPRQLPHPLWYLQSVSATDVALTFEYSNDMKTWQSGPAWFQRQRRQPVPRNHHPPGHHPPQRRRIYRFHPPPRQPALMRNYSKANLTQRRRGKPPVAE